MPPIKHTTRSYSWPESVILKGSVCVCFVGVLFWFFLALVLYLSETSWPSTLSHFQQRSDSHSIRLSAVTSAEGRLTAQQRSLYALTLASHTGETETQAYRHTQDCKHEARQRGEELITTFNNRNCKNYEQSLSWWLLFSCVFLKSNTARMTKQRSESKDLFFESWKFQCVSLSLWPTEHSFSSYKPQINIFHITSQLEEQNWLKSGPRSTLFSAAGKTQHLVLVTWPQCTYNKSLVEQSIWIWMAGGGRVHFVCACVSVCVCSCHRLI